MVPKVSVLLPSTFVSLLWYIQISVRIFFTKFSSTKSWESLFLKTFMGFFLRVYVCVVLLYSLFDNELCPYYQGCTSFHFCVGYSTLFNMFVILATIFNCTNHHFLCLSYQISITVQNLWGFLQNLSNTLQTINVNSIFIKHWNGRRGEICK